MSNKPTAAAVRAQARALLRDEGSAYSTLARSGEVGAPIQVHAPNGQMHSWFVPLTVGDRLAGFWEFLPDSSLLRYSSFQRREDSVDSCPAASAWVDVEVIRRHAQASARTGEVAGVPRLTYDRVPARLAWEVPLTAGRALVRRLFVAGQSVWEAAPAGADSDSYGSSPPNAGK